MNEYKKELISVKIHMKLQSILCILTLLTYTSCIYIDVISELYIIMKIG